MNKIWDIEELSKKNVNINPVQGEFFANLYGRTSAVFFNGASFKGEQTEIFAYYGIPNSPMPKGGYPAVVLVHGGGGMAFYEWVEYWNSKGYVAIAYDHSSRQYGSIYLEGKTCLLDNKKGGPKDCFNAFTITLDNYKEHWLYHGVNNAILCFNALRDTGIVNTEKIALTGISWGSVIGCIVMGLDQRFSCFAPLYGGGYLTSTNLYNLCEKPLDFNEEEWFKNFDPASYMANNYKPVQFTMGMDDHAFSPVSNAKTYELSKGKVTYSNRKTLTHGHLWMERRGTINVFRFIDSIINDNPTPFEIVDSKVENGYLLSRIERVENAKVAKFNYTFNDLEDSRNSKGWLWESFEIPLTDIKVKIPENATACMIEISDGNKTEYVQSTEVFLLK